MKEVKLESKFYVFNELSKLPEDIIHLMRNAIEARKKAYAPYSNFQLGAAILLGNNEIVTGSNQENASYPSGLCAERTAIYYAGSQYPDTKILKMAIVAGAKNKQTNKPISPCGACRQTIAEYEIKQDSSIELYFMGEKGKVVKSNSLVNLL